MQVRVLFFGVLKDLAGRGSDLLSLPDDAVAKDVLSHYAQRFSTKNGILNSIAISVNQEYARPDAKLNPGDEIALLPPVSGGATEVHETPSGSGSKRASITRNRIDTEELLDKIERPE